MSRQEAIRGAKHCRCAASIAIRAVSTFGETLRIRLKNAVACTTRLLRKFECPMAFDTSVVKRVGAEAYRERRFRLGLLRSCTTRFVTTKFAFVLKSDAD